MHRVGGVSILLPLYRLGPTGCPGMGWKTITSRVRAPTGSNDAQRFQPRSTHLWLVHIKPCRVWPATIPWCCTQGASAPLQGASAPPPPPFPRCICIRKGCICLDRSLSVAHVVVRHTRRRTRWEMQAVAGAKRAMQPPQKRPEDVETAPWDLNRTWCVDATQDAERKRTRRPGRRACTPFFFLFPCCTSCFGS